MKKNLRGYFVVLTVFFAIIFHIPVISNPGFSNHDEWQKLDHIEEHGFAHFAKAYSQIMPGTEFGFPVRPISFIEQGIAASFMASKPWVSHAIDVLIHILNGILLFLLTLRLSKKFKFSLACLLFFLLSPLAVFSTSWVGASVDRVYVFWGLLAAHAVMHYFNGNRPVFSILAVAVTFIAALFSKETALVLAPVLLIFSIFLLINRDIVFYKNRRFWGIAFILILVTVCYLLFRLPAIIGTLNGAAVSTYTPSISNAPINVLAYLIYPFSFNVIDMVSLPSISSSAILTAIILTSVLYLASILILGVKETAVYAIFYLVFLLPVVTLPHAGAHYLYASAIPFALLLSRLCFAPRSLISGIGTYGKVFAILLLCMLLVRFCKIENYFYHEGSCEKKVVDSLDAYLMESKNHNKSIQSVLIEADPKARGYIPQKSFFARSTMGRYKGIQFEYSADNLVGEESNRLRLRMSESCLLYK